MMVMTVSKNMSIKTKGCPLCMIAIPIGMNESWGNDDIEWNFCPKCGGKMYNVDADFYEGEEV